MFRHAVTKFLLAFIGLVLPLYCGAMTVNGVAVPQAYAWDDTEMPLVGAGTRSKWFMDLYVAALYLPGEESARHAKTILAVDQHQAITLHITSGMITSERMTEATLEGFDTATGGDTDSIQPEIDRFMAVFESAIKEGDVFDLVYVPGEGVNVLKNGDYQDTVGGLAFKKALFGIWLSETPVDEDLKSGLLGQR